MAQKQKEFETGKEFETKFLFKIVKLLGNHYKTLPRKEYLVTAALLNHKDDGKTTIFAIKALDYNLENKHWITIEIAAGEFEECISDFEIIKDGYDEYVKPIILDEVLLSWEKQEEGNWIVKFSSFLFKEKYGYDKIPISDVKRNILIGMDEYMFIYKSCYDLGKPSNYVVPIPNFQYRHEVEEWVKPLRRDVLDNRTAYGMNYRLLGIIK